MGPSEPLDNTKTNNSSEIKNCNQDLDMIDLNPVDKLTTKIATTQLSPLPQACTIQWGKKVYMSELDTSHKQFSITPQNKFHYHWTMIQ